MFDIVGKMLGSSARLLVAVSLLVSLPAATNAACTGTQVTQISPRTVSTNGGTRITLHGCGFSGNEFSQNDDPDVGNVVYINGRECRKHRDKNTLNQVTCYTYGGLQMDKGNTVSLVVDGVNVPREKMCPDNPDLCVVTAKNSSTPTTAWMAEQSGPPGSIIKLRGLLYTTRYGTNVSPEQKYRILRCWGPDILEPKNMTNFTSNDFYELRMDNEDSNFGTIALKSIGTFTGNSNVSCLIEGPYGNTQPDPRLYRKAPNTDKIYMFEYYQEITAIVPSAGGAGCTLRVEGTNFEDDENGYTKAKVYVGGQPCENVNVIRNSHLTCTVPEEPTGLQLYPGGRGVTVETWDSLSVADDAAARDTTQPATTTIHADEASFSQAEGATGRVRMTFVFVPDMSGPYKFGLFTTSQGSLYMDGALVTSSAGGWTDGETRFDLTEGEWKHIVAVTAGGNVSVRARQLNSPITPMMMGKAHAETQRVVITTNVTDEEFTMSFAGFSTSSASSSVVDEKQTVCITEGDGPIQLGLYGVLAAPAPIDDAHSIKLALDQLPLLEDGESFTVEAGSTGCVAITFHTGRGDIPEFECDPDHNITVTENVKGKPDNSMYALLYNTVPSPLINFSDNETQFTENLEKALDGMFSVRCPAMFEDESGTVEGYETTGSTENSFCGRKSLKNSWNAGTNVGKNIHFSSQRWMCFAVHGLDNNFVYLKSERTRDQEVSYRRNRVQFEAIEAYGLNSPGWKFACMDLLTQIRNTGGNLDTDRFILQDISFSRNDPTTDFFIDQLIIGGESHPAVKAYYDQLRNNGNLNYLRLGPALPNAQELFTMDEAYLTPAAGGSGNTYDVVLKPNNCGSSFELLKLANSEETQVTGDGLTSTLSGGSGSMTVVRSGTASPAVTGPYTLVYEGTPIELMGDFTDEEIETTFGATSDLPQKLGRVSVERTKESTCANIDISLRMLDKGGDQPLITLDETKTSLSPPSASVTVVPKTDGFLEMSPIYGGYAFTAHTTPQVQVYINSIVSKCGLADNDCSFTYDASVLPEVTGITPASAAPGSTVAIAGNRFSTVLEQNAVYLGGVSCVVTVATASQIDCTVGDGASGPADVKVVTTAGNSTGSVTFTYVADLTSCDILEDGHGGGSMVTCAGYGFSDNTVVKFDDVECEIHGAVSPSSIAFHVPVYELAEQGVDYTVSVKVFDNSAAAVPWPTTLTFNYRASLTPEVTEVIGPAVLQVAGGEQITIKGSGLGTSGGKVFLGDKELTIDSQADDEIVVTTPPGLSTGDDVPFVMKVGTGGGRQPVMYAVPTIRRKRAAASAQLPTGTIMLNYNSVVPSSGSVFGGTELTISGIGFGNDKDKLKVMVGKTECIVKSAHNTQFICQIQSRVQTHIVTNKGTTGFGTYYAFSETLLNIRKGDKVRFEWTTPDFIQETILHGAYQIDSLVSNTRTPGGFGSTTSTRTGTFTHQFMDVKDYYIMSGFVDSLQLRNYKMTVSVSDQTAVVEGIVITIGGSQPATYQEAGPKPSPACEVGSSGLPVTCSNPSTPPTDGTFLFDPCLTPEVTAVTLTNAYTSLQRSMASDTQLTFTGDGFTSTSPATSAECQPSGVIGSCGCIPDSHTATELKCTPDPACFTSSLIGQSQETGLLLQPYGYAFMNILQSEDRVVYPMATVDSFTPVSGSQQGGTRVTFTGVGLDNSTMAYFNSVPGSLISSSPWVWETPATGSTGAVSLTTKQTLPVICRAAPCTFTYQASETPTVTSATFSQKSEVTFDGQNFQNDIQITIGGVDCTPVIRLSATQMTCKLNELPPTTDIVMTSDSMGNADVSGLQIINQPVLTTVTPTEGSIYGGTILTLDGSGFIGTTTIVSTDGTATCDLKLGSSTPDSLECWTQPHSDGTVSFTVTSNGQTSGTMQFTFNQALSPTISSLTPTSGSGGNVLDIVGTNFDAVATQGNKVWFGDDPSVCLLNDQSVTATSLSCNIQDHPNGLYDVRVHNAFGFSDSAEFTYTFTTTGVFPTSGDSNGGQIITVSGFGLTSLLTVDICGTVCTEIQVTNTEYTCATPGGAVGSPCDVEVYEDSSNKKVAGTYDYLAGVAPTVTGVSPARGGTAGGTTIDISGTGFSSFGGTPTVTIAGSPCSVTAGFTNTLIQCVTSAHTGTITANVEVALNPLTAVSSVTFQYVDVWSSVYTWGGDSAPQEGEFIVISKGQSILLDVTTPRLAFLLIQGGSLIFDEADIELNADSILVTDGGALQVGTEDEPFQHKAKIKLYGHHLCKELPIYGCKVLAVRQGTLDLHGKDINPTWTLLDATANAGESSITLKVPVPDWSIGNEIVIATTGRRASLEETEVRKITGISADQRTLTLDEALSYKHLGQDETYWTWTLQYRAEVGLLTRNVGVEGNDDNTWHDTYEACPDGFDVGEFKTQTCFQGRFGDGVSSSEFGGTVMLHSPNKNAQDVVARISNAEFSFMGQAFKLGRYPIHFHRNGDMSNSYVNKSSIHHTFNRAINIHDSYNIRIENNVAYNVMGGAFFLEDGIETGNVFDSNFLVYVRSSTSLLNDDITPAGIWVTNPNNVVSKNHVAGGTHFGIWYRLDQHPMGPSATNSICPLKVPLGVFEDNVAHSMGWFGLWIFPEYYPMVGGSCSSMTDPEVAVFKRFHSWNNEKGAEWVDVGALRFEDSVFAQNEKAGFEGKRIIGASRCNFNTGAVMSGCLFVGRADDPSLQTGHASEFAAIIPFFQGFMILDSYFKNFDVLFRQTKIDGVCGSLCNGFPAYFKGLTFSNVNTKFKLEYVHQSVYVDIDGSLAETGVSNKILVSSPDSAFPPGCTPFSAADDFFDPAHLGAVSCPATVAFHRLSFNNPKPSSREATQVTLQYTFGSSKGDFAHKRITHPDGWVVVIPDQETVLVAFDDTTKSTNISFTGVFYEFEVGHCVILEFDIAEEPSVVSITRGEEPAKTPTVFDCSSTTAKTGDWYYDDARQVVGIGFFGDGTMPYEKDCDTVGPFKDIPVDLNIYKCFFTDCIVPAPPGTVPPETARPSVFQYWHDQIWEWNSTLGEAHTLDGGSYALKDGDNAVIKDYQSDLKTRWWVVMDDNSLPSLVALGKLTVFGVLEIDPWISTFELKVDTLVVFGRLIVGWPTQPMINPIAITLTGNLATPYYPQTSGATIGAKAIAAVGGIDVHGQPVATPWTRLSQTASATATSVVVDDDISGWRSGQRVILTSTSYDLEETEMMVIDQITNGNTIQFTTALKYDHTAIQVGTTKMAAAVGLVDRSVTIQGEDNGEEFGGRVLVSSMQHPDTGDLYAGYGRFSDVEFKHMGQFAYTDLTDPRLGLVYLDTGEVDANRPSHVTNCTFWELYNSAIGVFGTSNLGVTGSVVYEAVGNAIWTESDGTTLENNLVSKVYWTGSWRGRSETYNFNIEAGFRVTGATKLEMLGNYAAGSQRTGYSISGEDCVEPVMSLNNEAVGNLMGVGIFPDDVIQQTATQDCVRLSGFTVWKNYDYGIYYQNTLNLEVKENFFSDNGVSVFPMILGPGALTHECKANYVNVELNTFIGAAGDCFNTAQLTGTYISLSDICRAPKADGKQVGVQAAIISSATNRAPTKPCSHIMAYNTLCGSTKIADNNFEKFDGQCAVAISNSPDNDDMNFPIEVSGLLFDNVPLSARLVFTRPNVGKINPSDCVDMDCDAMKKLAVNDLDGSLLGQVGAAVAESEWQWDGDRVRGLGDYRIPKTMLTDPETGNQLTDPIYNNLGIVRDSSCTAVNVTTTAFYNCPGLSYRHLVIESLDEDTEKRRLSPVAVLSDGYLDLINGPQDHGWCNGYTCQKRVSLFHALVLPGRDVLIHLSSTTPVTTRLFMMNAEPSECLLVKFFYGDPNRVDVYVPSNTPQLARPLNGVFSDTGAFLSLQYDPTGVAYIPSCSSNIHGDNYIDRDNKLLFVILKGKDEVQMKKVSAFLVKFGFPSLTEDEFYSKNLVSNIAVALDIDLSKIRVVKIVSGATSGRRRRRAASSLEVDIECGDSPTESLADSSYERMVQLASDMMNYCQGGVISDILNVDDVSCDEIEFEEITYVPAKPEDLGFVEEVVSQHEGVPFATQPKLQAFDSDGSVIDYLGIVDFPWEITARLRPGTGHPDAELTGTVTIPFENGTFGYTDLAISHAGSGYVIEFYISSPAGHENLTLLSAPIVVEGRPLTTGVYSMTSGHILQNSVFTLTLDLRDELTDDVISNISWRGHTFDVTCNLTLSMDPWGLSGSLSTTFDDATGRANFADLAFSGYGIIYLGCKVESTPAEYEFYSYHEAVIVSAAQQSVAVEATNIVTLRFNVDYNTYIGSDTAKYQLLQAVTYKLAKHYPDVVVTNADVSPGSIIVTFTIEGLSANVTSVTQLLCSDISSGSTVTVGGTTLTYDSFMTVDGTNYYPTCSSDEDEDEGLHPGYIALIAVLAALVLGLVVVLLVWVFKIRPRHKTHGVRRWTVAEYPGEKGTEDRNSNTRYGGGFYYIDNGRTVFVPGPSTKMQGVFFKQNVDMDMNRPLSAAPISTLYDGDQGLPVRRSPNLKVPHDATMEIERSLTPTG